jgi:hypothetical protein
MNKKPKLKSYLPAESRETAHLDMQNAVISYNVRWEKCVVKYCHVLELHTSTLIYFFSALKFCTYCTEANILKTGAIIEKIRMNKKVRRGFDKNMKATV